MQKIFKNFKSAFTLAEVLITLGIIGVVAAMTIPNLIKENNKSELAQKFKKEYSVLSSAWKNILTDNGGYAIGLYQNSDAALNALCLELKCIEKCYSSQYPNHCVTKKEEIKTLDGVSVNNWLELYGSTGIIADGSSFTIRNWYPNCDYLRNNYTTCTYLYFDTNGLKKPNTIGRDIFELWITRNKVTPSGAYGTGFGPDSYCDPKIAAIYNGASCGAKIILEGSMNY